MNSRFSQRISEKLLQKETEKDKENKRKLNEAIRKLGSRDQKGLLTKEWLEKSLSLLAVLKDVELKEIELDSNEGEDEEEACWGDGLLAGIVYDSWKRIELSLVFDVLKTAEQEIAEEVAENPEHDLESREMRSLRKQSTVEKVKKPSYKKKETSKEETNVNKSTPKVGNTANNDKGVNGKIRRPHEMEIQVEFSIDNPYISTPKNITQLTPKDPGSLRSNASHKNSLNDENPKKRKSVLKTPKEESPSENRGEEEIKEEEDDDQIKTKKKRSKMSSMTGKHLQKMKNKKKKTSEKIKKTEEIPEEDHNIKQKDASQAFSNSPIKKEEALERKMPKSIRLQTMRLIEMENPSKYEMERLKREGVPKYTDGFFPPRICSLLRNTKKLKWNSFWKNFKWLRIRNELFDANNLSLCESIEPFGMVLNNLSNSYFTGALNALAETPSRLIRLFGDQIINEEGCYHVFLNLRGIWRAIVVDDFIPVILENENEQPEIAFVNPDPAKTKSKVDVWFMLLEKAWAKVLGTYESIENGTVCSFLRDLTGAPTYELLLGQNQDQEVLWSILDECFRKNYIVVAEPRDKSSSESSTIIQSTEISSETGETLRLCRLRGRLSSSLYSESSCTLETLSKLAENFKKYKGETDLWSLEANTAIFSLKEITTHFGNLTICLYAEGFEYISTVIRQKANAFSVIRFKIEEDSQCYIEASQLDAVFFGEELLKKKFYEYSPLHLFILKENGPDFEVVDGAFQINQRNCFVALDLPQGTYYAVVAVNWRNKLYDVVVNYYGSENPTEFQRLHMKSFPNILNSGLFEHAVKNGGKTERIGESTVDKYKCEIPQWGVECWAYVNQSNEKACKVSEEVKMEESKAVLGDPSPNGVPDQKDLEQKGEVDFEIEPNGRRVLYFKKT